MITQVPDNHSGAWGQFGAYSCVSVFFHIGCSRIPSLFTLKYLTAREELPKWPSSRKFYVAIWSNGF